MEQLQMQAVREPLSSSRATVHTGPFLVAADGSEESAQALAIARVLARHAHAEVEVRSVLEPLNVIVPSPATGIPPVHAGATRVESCRERLAASAKQGDWFTEIVLGDVARSIVQRAEERDARLILTGLVRHGALERVMRLETPLVIARGAGVPVLAVPRAMTSLPRCVVVAVGSRDAAAHIGSVAGVLMGEAVAVHLVHVKPRRTVYYEPELREDDADYEARIQRQFAETCGSWTLPADVPVQTHILSGRSIERLLDFADDVEADLIVVGHSPKAPLRWLRQGMAARVFRGASCAVLLVPEPRDGAQDAELTRVSSDPAEWTQLLQEFARRNVARLASLVVDEGEAGERVVVHDLPLLGTDYDARARVVTVLVGGLANDTNHLTHRVAMPSVIAVQRHAQGSDELLVVGYEGGQLQLTLR